MSFSVNNQPPDDLDRLLSRALPGIVPEPFPAFEYPTEPPRRVKRWDWSRVTLALSVVGLLGLGLLLAPGDARLQPTSAVPNPGLFERSTADGRELLRRLNLETMPEPMK